MTAPGDMTLARAGLVVTLGLLAYGWLLYPLLLALPARRRATPRDTKIAPPSPLPDVHVIVAAFNEESVIAARIRNLKALDYPPERLHGRLGADGCTDRTAAEARDAIGGDPRFHIHEYPRNRGKVAVLRDLVAAAAADIGKDTDRHLLVFTDANTEFAPDAVARLTRPFADPAIGAVCGRLILRPAHAAPRPLRTEAADTEESSYWRFETILKTWESAVDSCLGANGAIYAIRPALFWRDIPVNTIVDDFVIGMKVRETGHRVVYDPTAVAAEELPALRSEWGRRVRIGAGDYQALWLCRACLLPRFGWFAWIFFSHKVLRWFTPHLLLLAMLLPLVRLLGPYPTDILDRSILAAAGVAVAAAALGRAGRRGDGPRGGGGTGGRLAAVARLTDHFLTMQAALLVGFLRFCRGRLGGAWRRTPRSA